MRFQWYIGFLGLQKKKKHRLGDLNNSNVFSCNSGGWKPKIKVTQWFLLRPVFLAYRRPTSSSFFTCCSLCPHIPGVFLCPNCLSYKDISLIDYVLS